MGLLRDRSQVSNKVAGCYPGLAVLGRPGNSRVLRASETLEQSHFSEWSPLDRPAQGQQLLEKTTEDPGVECSWPLKPQQEPPERGH